MFKRPFAMRKLVSELEQYVGKIYMSCFVDNVWTKGPPMSRRVEYLVAEFSIGKVALDQSNRRLRVYSDYRDVRVVSPMLLYPVTGDTARCAREHVEKKPFRITTRDVCQSLSYNNHVTVASMAYHEKARLCSRGNIPLLYVVSLLPFLESIPKQSRCAACAAYAEYIYAIEDQLREQLKVCRDNALRLTESL